MKKIIFAVCLVSIVVFFSACSREDAPWPSRAITIIVPFSPGGDSDFNARQYAIRLGEILGQTVVVQNMAGQGGVLGATHVLNARPDGYTALFWHTSIFTMRAAGLSDMRLDDFELAAIPAQGGFGVVVNGRSPWYTIDDFLAASRENPDSLMFAVSLGTAAHLTGVFLNDIGGQFRLVDIGDVAQRTISLLGNHIHGVTNPVGPSQPYLETGDFRFLALFTPERNPVFTDIPTAVELGFPEASLPINYFIAFPRGTPSEIVERFTDALEQVYQMDDYRASILNVFQQAPFFLRGQEARDYMRAQEEFVMRFSDELRR